MPGPSRSSGSHSRARCSSSEPRHRDWSRCSHYQSQPGYDAVSLRQLAPPLYIIYYNDLRYFCRFRPSSAYTEYIFQKNRSRLAPALIRGFFGGRDVINIAQRFRFVEWRGTPAIPALPIALRRHRSIGNRIARVIGSQGRAVARVRTRKDAGRVQNRDTEKGAVARTTRASRDIHVRTGSILRSVIYITMSCMVGAANRGRNDCIIEIFEDISLGSCSIAKILILFARRVETCECIDVLCNIPLVGLLQRTALKQPIGTSEPTLNPAPLLSLHGCVALAIVRGDAHLALVSLDLDSDACLIELSVRRLSAVFSLGELLPP